MRKGSSYKALESVFRCELLALMNFYEVDGNNQKFIEILDKCVDEIKQTKKISLIKNSF